MRDIFNTVTIGERIKSRREALNMSPSELAYKCGYKSTQSISLLEAGICKGSRKVYEKISNALDMPYIELVDGCSAPNPFPAGSASRDIDAKRVMYFNILDRFLPNLELDPEEFRGYLEEHSVKVA